MLHMSVLITIQRYKEFCGTLGIEIFTVGPSKFTGVMEPHSTKVPLSFGP
jgi:hypothetical protein